MPERRLADRTKPAEELRAALHALGWTTIEESPPGSEGERYRRVMARRDASLVWIDDLALGARTFAIDELDAATEAALALRDMSALYAFIDDEEASPWRRAGALLEAAALYDDEVSASSERLARWLALEPDHPSDRALLVAALVAAERAAWPALVAPLERISASAPGALGQLAERALGAIAARSMRSSADA